VNQIAIVQVSMESTIILLNCVFQLNAFDYYLGGYYDIELGSGITVIRGVLDFQSINTTESVSFSTTVPVLLDVCVTATQSPTERPIMLSLGAIMGIVRGCVLGVVLVILAVFTCRRKWSTRDLKEE